MTASARIFFEGREQDTSVRAVARMSWGPDGGTVLYTITSDWCHRSERALQDLCFRVATRAAEASEVADATLVAEHSDLRNHNVGLQASLEEARAMRRRAEAELESVDKLVVEHQATIQELQEDIQRLTGEIDLLRAAQADGGWRALAKRQIKELEAKDQLIASLEEASAEDQRKIDELQAKVDALDLDSNHMAVEANKAHAQIRDQQAKIIALTEGLRSLLSNVALDL